MPPSLGISQKKFKVGQTHNFKVFGDGLSNAKVTALTTTVPNLVWSNIQTPGHGPNHVNVKADLATSPAERTPRDTVGDLTVTVKDDTTNETTTQAFSVTYTP